MPIYNFKCDKCGLDFEDLVANRGDNSPCPDCGSKKVSRQISVPAPHQSSGNMKMPSCGIDGNGPCACTPESCPHLN